MAILERILLVIVAAVVGTVGMVNWFLPEKQAGPVFSPAETVTRMTESPQPEGALPVKVPGTQLRIQALVRYEGPYWEDGTGEHVSNVAALLLENTGEEGISYAQVSLLLDGNKYEFEFTYLPAGARVLVPEKNRQPYVLGQVTDCRCGRLVTASFGSDTEKVRVRQNGMAGIVLENLTDRDLKTVCLYYKLYLSGEDVYIGGTTYRMEAGQLPSGGNLEVTPEHFVWGYSAVVDIRTGEE